MRFFTAARVFAICLLTSRLRFARRVDHLFFSSTAVSLNRRTFHSLILRVLFYSRCRRRRRLL